jgi:DNA-binding NtrC family response regulator
MASYELIDADTKEIIASYESLESARHFARSWTECSAYPWPHDPRYRDLARRLHENARAWALRRRSALRPVVSLAASTRQRSVLPQSTTLSVRLRGVMDGIDLTREVKIRWPLLPVILTSGHPCERVGELPPGVTYIPKPWQPLKVLIAAEQALASRV